MDDIVAFVVVGGLLVLCLLFTFVVKDLTPYSIVRVMNGADYFFHHRVPWTGLAASAGVGAALVLASIRIVERRDF